MNKKEYYDIFISYRRIGGWNTAKHLYDLLRHDDYAVSFDIDTLREGDFDKELLRRIDNCTDFILILDEHVFDRCIDPNFDRNKDWLRIELAHALEKGKNIIPIGLSGFKGFPDNLPSDIEMIKRKNVLYHTQKYFDAFYDKLRSFLHSQPIQQSTSIEGYNAFLKITTDIDCRVFVDGEEKMIATAGKVNRLPLRGGSYMLKFVSTACDADVFKPKSLFRIQPHTEELYPVELIPIRDERIVKERHIQEEEERKQKEEAEALARKIKAEEERKKSIHEGHTFVDLGLSVKWATCNVGANSPEKYGNYYAWGEIEPKANYTRENSKTWGKSLGDIGVNPSHDAARVAWGGSWRLPTKAELEELKNRCTWSWTTQNGNKGYKVTGPSGNSIFLPAGGWYGTSLYNDGSYGDYWSSTPDESDTGYAYYLDFNSGYHNVSWDYRNYGFSVRPVVEEKRSAFDSFDLFNSLKWRIKQAPLHTIKFFFK